MIGRGGGLFGPAVRFTLLMGGLNITLFYSLRFSTEKLPKLRVILILIRTYILHLHDTPSR